NPKPLIIELLDMMFPQPEWDPLCFLIKAESKNKLNGKTRFIGKDRQLIILVNSVIPFFLAWSKKHGNQELEKTLFSLFLLLPPEGKNKKTVFLEQRLFVSHPEFKIINNLGYYQGLIQLYDDCCRSFYEGCLNCSLLERLK
ncbi:MAG: hypothetical protein OEY59_11420, partial [Deltaproteobacteria bacterium]|nr:hypothetical protein [Deltaproteobacteria bacterium]